MKKLIALVLCAALLGCCAAMAETAETKDLIGTVTVRGAFNIVGKLPDGYRVFQTASSTDQVYAEIASEDTTKPHVTLSIAFNESYTREDGTALNLNEVSDEDMELIRTSFNDLMNVTDMQETETAHGTKLLMVKGTLAGQSLVVFYTIYDSYEIELSVQAGAGADRKELTEEQVQMIVDFISGLEFVEAAQ